ncbi:MAG: HPF/RaiA family ribosome-associated protein [Flavobacteriales bacterium]|nr:MAG: HPF/RaiA family ribosome-associated protein [Flavobacteriales bacterium]
MNIQLNADNNLTIHEPYQLQIKAQLTKDLGRFSNHISRLEVHLSDENGSKAGLNDKRCLIEAKLEGKPSIVASDLGDTYDIALKSATEKIKSALNTTISKMQAK